MSFLDTVWNSGKLAYAASVEQRHRSEIAREVQELFLYANTDSEEQREELKKGKEMILEFRAECVSLGAKQAVRVCDEILGYISALFVNYDRGNYL